MTDVDDVLRLLDGLKQRELLPARLKCGAVEVSFGGVLGVDNESTEDPREEELRLRDEIDQMAATQYGAGMGGHVPGMDMPD